MLKFQLPAGGVREVLANSASRLSATRGGKLLSVVTASMVCSGGEGCVFAANWLVERDELRNVPCCAIMSADIF